MMNTISPVNVLPPFGSAVSEPAQAPSQSSQPDITKQLNMAPPTFARKSPETYNLLGRLITVANPPNMISASV